MESSWLVAEGEYKWL